ncbi:MAG TPA: PolC-type DNA polymerase III, partial [Clostridiales bacterium]|nr:PolC-type DNA polymerase III [Clostridiales bacterium]
MFKTMGLQNGLQGYVKDTYGADCRVMLRVGEGAATAEYRPSGEAEKLTGPVDEAKEKQPKKPQSEERAVPSGGKKPAARPPAKKKQMEEAPVSAIVDLAVGNRYVIDGEVVAVEAQSLKDGELTKHKFVVCDYTGSVTCFFLESKKYRQRLEPPGKGRWVRVEGQYDTDAFAHENTLKVKDIGRSSHVPRKDEAAEKRVELHVHTQMSAQDAVTSAKDLIARAAQWGHKAIAITDHGVVQAFPEAERAAKQHGIKVLYGVEGYLVDDTRPLYEGAAQLSFRDEFVVFDIETTGLSALHCDITEIGAVRITGGEIVERFSTFVRPSAPIPPAVVALTGITDEMVGGAPRPKEALSAFRAFCG